MNCYLVAFFAYLALHEGQPVLADPASQIQTSGTSLLNADDPRPCLCENQRAVSAALAPIEGRYS